MSTAHQIDRDAIRRFLEVKGWKRDSDTHCTRFVSPSGDWAVEHEEGFDVDFVTVCKLSDADVQVQDVGAVATPRWVTVGDECYTADGLEKELVSLGAIEWECPNCGETGGHPRSIHSREFQGDRAHGGYVEFEEEGCSKCMQTRWV